MSKIVVVVSLPKKWDKKEVVFQRMTARKRQRTIKAKMVWETA